MWKQSLKLNFKLFYYYHYRTVYVMVRNLFSGLSQMVPLFLTTTQCLTLRQSKTPKISRFCPCFRCWSCIRNLAAVCSPMGSAWERWGTEAWDLLFHRLFSQSSISYSNTHTTPRVDTWTDRPCSLSFSGFSFSFSLSTWFKSLHYLNWRSYTIQPWRDGIGMRSRHKSI